MEENVGKTYELMAECYYRESHKKENVKWIYLVNDTVQS